MTQPLFRPIVATPFPWRWSLLGIALVAAVAPVRAADDPQPLTDHQKIVHVLNRLGFGPRPGDVERVEKMGLDAYIQQQLHPETIDDAVTEKALVRLDTLQMSSSHLMDEFYGDIRRFIDQQKVSGDPAEMKLRYGIDIKQKNAGPATKPAGEAKKPELPNFEELSKRDALRCVGELQDAKLIRAALSERQLNEVLVDFWSNHFNIDVKKNSCRALKTADDREKIRPHVLGKFHDLLMASATSPAMLVYLDNNENSVVRERSNFEKKAIEMYVSAKFGMDAKGIMANKEGPNENYGREILELHTLGVDGGYTQKDVQEVARCFSGWTLNPFNAKFQFDSNRHDNGQKLVLGHTIPADGGVKDGMIVIDILATHPSTAKFISRKLCRRFVADDPPAELVDRIAQTFQDTDGDLRKVTEAILTSPEFFSASAYRAKIKSPFEYAVSAVRATGGRFVDPAFPIWGKVQHVAEGAGTIGYGAERLSSEKRKSLNWHVYEMGEPLFACAAPTGYTEISSKWVNPGALIDRLNFALALTQQ
ncbi:MAG: hypothetical protein JWL69_381, partial [Phycisphaerales bacterium]|nr:hypothetical protein [Phycisphaerales bacterium]